MSERSPLQSTIIYYRRVIPFVVSVILLFALSSSSILNATVDDAEPVYSSWNDSAAGGNEAATVQPQKSPSFSSRGGSERYDPSNDTNAGLQQDNEADDEKDSINKRWGDRVPIVCVDAGHGGVDVGTYHEELYEKTLNLDMALRLGTLLESTGVKVVYTRDKDILLGLRKIPAIANEANADLLISIHCNAIENLPEHKGSETLYRSVSKSVSMDSKRFARLVQDELVKALGTDDNGIMYRPNLAVLRLAEMPAVIAEIAYITNADDRAKLELIPYRQKASEALFRAVINTLDIIY